LNASLEPQSATEWKSIEMRATFVDLLTHALIVGTAALATPDRLNAKAAAKTMRRNVRDRLSIIRVTTPHQLPGLSSYGRVPTTTECAATNAGDAT
jgi:hypothetical protein